jgi:hypothetical protein
VNYVRSISVRDESGATLTLYEFQDRRLFRKIQRWKLDTGELVEERHGSLVVTRTGEKLARLDCG